MRSPIVEVVPATVHTVTAVMRHTSREHSAAGWRLSSSLPLMPPVFHARTQLDLDGLAVRLQGLAVALELDAAGEEVRVGLLVDAGGRAIAGDIGTAGSDL